MTTLALGMFLMYGSIGLAGWLIMLGPRPTNLLTRKDAPFRVAGTPSAGFGQLITDRIAGLLRRRNLSVSLATSLEQAGLKAKPAEFIVFAVVGTTLAGLVTLILTNPFLAVVVCIASPLAVRVLLQVLSGRRRSRFADQLDETLQLLAGGLRAGHSLLRAIDAAADESEAPTSEEFTRIINETRLGRDLGEALEDASARMRSLDFSWVAQAIAIHREVGGNLADVLDQVGHTIRERNQVRGQVKALSAEGKISALILMALPFALSGILIVVSPGYMDPMFEHPLGLLMIVVSIIMLTVGGVWLKKVVSFSF
jgi:tight adherence protein B